MNLPVLSDIVTQNSRGPAAWAPSGSDWRCRITGLLHTHCPWPRNEQELRVVFILKFKMPLCGILWRGNTWFEETRDRTKALGAEMVLADTWRLWERPERVVPKDPGPSGICHTPLPQQALISPVTMKPVGNLSEAGHGFCGVCGLE